MRTIIWEELFFFLWIIGLVQPSHYITTTLLESGEVFQSYTFVLWTDRICARRSLAARHRSKSPHLVSALLVSNYCCFRRCTVRVCERVRVCTKGLTALTCRKDVKSVITLADNKWFSRVWMCVWIACTSSSVGFYKTPCAPSQHVILLDSNASLMVNPLSFSTKSSQSTAISTHAFPQAFFLLIKYLLSLVILLPLCLWPITRPGYLVRQS